MLSEQKSTAERAQQDEKLLTVEQAANLLGIRRQTAYEWIKGGKLIACRVGKRDLRLKHGQVMATLKELIQPDGRRKYARRTR